MMDVYYVCPAGNGFTEIAGTEIHIRVIVAVVELDAPVHRMKRGDEQVEIEIELFPHPEYPGTRPGAEKSSVPIRGDVDAPFPLIPPGGGKVKGMKRVIHVDKRPPVILRFQPEPDSSVDISEPDHVLIFL